MGAIRDCHLALHAMGVVRIHTDVKLGTGRLVPSPESRSVASSLESVE